MKFSIILFLFLFSGIGFCQTQRIEKYYFGKSGINTIISQPSGETIVVSTFNSRPSLIKKIAELRLKNWLQLLLLTIALFIVFLFYNNGDFVLNGEEALLTKIDIGTEVIVPRKYKPPYNFIFINVGKDLAVVKDELGGDNVITDRTKLASIFKILADHDQHKYVLADILFDLPADNDSALSVQITRLKRAVFPTHRKDSGLIEPVFPVHTALADYNTNTHTFSRFRLMYNDTIKTIPVVMQEELQQVHYHKNWFGLFCNGKYCFQTIPPRYHIRQYQLQNTADYPYFNLGDLLMLSEDTGFYNQFLKDKFVVLGNFETDIHYTPIGKMPGVLVLLNTYLSLLDGRQQPSIAWAITMFVIFFLINVSLLYGNIKIPKPAEHKKWWKVFVYHQFHGIVANFISIAGLCLFISFLSELIFHIKPHTFIIFMYIVMMQEIIKYYRIWKEEQQES